MAESIRRRHQPGCPCCQCANSRVNGKDAEVIIAGLGAVSGGFSAAPGNGTYISSSTISVSACCGGVHVGDSSGVPKVCTPTGFPADYGVDAIINILPANVRVWVQLWTLTGFGTVYSFNWGATGAAAIAAIDQLYDGNAVVLPYIGATSAFLSCTGTMPNNSTEICGTAIGSTATMSLL